MADLYRCYKVLGLPKEATVEEINRQYKDLVAIWHPDRFTNNPRLQKKAENHMAQINAARDTLIHFLKSGQPFPEFNDQATKSQGAAQSGSGGPPPKGAHEKEDGPDQSEGQWPETKPKRTWLWRLVYLFSISLVISSLFISPKIKNWYPLLDNPAEYLKHTVKSAAYEMFDEVSKTGKPPIEPPKVDNSNEKQKRPLIEQLVEIQLVDGSVIVAKSCSIEDDMLIYQLKHGSMGIERSRVKAIKVIEIASK